MANSDMMVWMPERPVTQTMLQSASRASNERTSMGLISWFDADDGLLEEDDYSTLVAVQKSRRLRELRESTSESALIKRAQERNEVKRLWRREGKLQEATIRARSNRRVRKVCRGACLRWHA